jgi:murein DD-endopeptidase MepM/ murein hydrolase activator NlpD
MKVILLAERVGRHVSLSHGQALLLAVLLLLLLPVLVGTVTYRVHALLGDSPEARNVERLLQQERLLAAQQREIQATRRNAELHLNALAQRLGQMQAQMLRLNALGQRLTQMAGLSKVEFNFSEPPAMGGPAATHSRNAAVPDFLKTLEVLSGEIERKSERLSALEGLLLDRQLRAAVHPQGWPTEGGWVSSGYGLRTDPFSGHTSVHEGVDIASRLGSPIRALGGGVVSFASDRSGREGYGLTVEINHGDGYTTRYAHAGSLLVKVGDRVTKGQIVALVGTSGRSTGPHLHLEVMRDGRQVNPLSYLRTPRQ